MSFPIRAFTPWAVGGHVWIAAPASSLHKWLTHFSHIIGTKQVCFFRDSYDDLTKTGLAIYGLSSDSGKANTSFKEKYKLSYPLLCDPDATLIAAIGLKKSPKGTQRGVFVVDKSGKVLAAEPGSPAGTVDVVKALVEGSDEAPKDETEEANGAASEDKKEKEETSNGTDKKDDKDE